MVYRVYVGKRAGFDVQAQQLLTELRDIVGIAGIQSVRMLNRYDVEGIDEQLFEQCIPTVFSEPPVDVVYRSLDEIADYDLQTVFATEYLPGQFDQRADSASECIQLISQGERPTVRTAIVYILDGELSRDDIERIQQYVINPVEARLASLEPKATLRTAVTQPGQVARIAGFTQYTNAQLEQMIAEYGLAMDLADLQFTQQYFVQQQRDPTITEIRVIDTYWSDHCRHTTFGTQLDEIDIDNAVVQAAFDRYLSIRKELGRENRPVSLMDMGTIGAKWLKSQGILQHLDESEEINACTVKVKVDVNGHDEDWLFLFKNETHNHPTEIEPFGGAATCIGGCIRDPLSGRAYVYQAMRVTGAADPTVPVSQTLEGKLPQRKLVTGAAAGYSSYGNQIGLATGQVHEIYHLGYMAKRMEVGAVVAATPADHVRRETPAAGDRIILLGGRTGRDGIGGATGSSKAHNVESLELDGAEVQKGNAPVERKLQRLFRRGEATRLIKRCNDFGAGGVSVAVGEIADGLRVNLDAVPKKYDGLDGTELAISESQERMAVDVAAEDVNEFLQYACEENLEATVIAEVTAEPRMVMQWNGDTIVDLSREFLSSNGAPKHQQVHVLEAQVYQSPWADGSSFASTSERMRALVSDLNNAGNKGLVERFDSTIGAGTVLMPFGGRRQLTEPMAMVAKLPVDGDTTTASAMAWGFNPFLSERNQFTGAYVAVVESLARLVAAGYSRKQAYLSFQEYFEKLRDTPERWGKPVASVLGALMAQIDLGVGAIGGKDSMSGSFEDLDVPPTLISFAVAVGDVSRTTSPEFKGAGHRVVRLMPAYEADGITPVAASLQAVLDAVEELIGQHAVLAASTPGYGCTAGSLFQMALGNRIGLKQTAANSTDTASTTDTANTTDAAHDTNAYVDGLFSPAYGSFVLELADNAQVDSVLETAFAADAQLVDLGVTSDEYVLSLGSESVDMAELEEVWASRLEDVFPYRSTNAESLPQVAPITADVAASDRHRYSGTALARPRVIIPVFPGNNCEYDVAAAFERAGAEAQTFVVNNLSPSAVAESTHALALAIRNSQIVMLPGGFSGGDEPDGSAKFITAFFRAPEVTEAVRDLLNNRDGLMLGICNGFQALIKLGLVPYGDIIDIDEQCPTLTFNTIGRHQSKIVHTRVASTLSPWLAGTQAGDVHTIAISHGEGRFVATPEMLQQLQDRHQIATQYTDELGVPSMDLEYNPNGSMLAVEGITSPDGRVFGKMGHTERSGEHLYMNIPHVADQPLFESGVAYFA